jgi:hypothetical protein
MQYQVQLAVLAVIATMAKGFGETHSKRGILIGSPLGEPVVPVDALVCPFVENGVQMKVAELDRGTFTLI